MAPVEFHRYKDSRGDTIIYKFDAEVTRKPDPQWPDDSAITVYQHYVITKRTGTVHYHSDLQPLGLAIDRSRTDKAASQPPIGKVMHTENASMDDNTTMKTKTQYIWKGWSHGEGYRRGWAKLCVSRELANDLSTKPPLAWGLQTRSSSRLGNTWSLTRPRDIAAPRHRHPTLFTPSVSTKQVV